MQEVTKQVVEAKAAEAILLLRHAFGKVKVFRDWLADNPGYDADSYLVKELGFDEGMAYSLHLVFDELDSARIDLAPTMAVARKFTALE